MTTAIGILVLAIAFAVKYGSALYSGAAWMWSKVPALRLPSLPSRAESKTKSPTAAEAFAALSLIQNFKANCGSDPSYKLITAALKEVTA